MSDDSIIIEVVRWGFYTGSVIILGCLGWVVSHARGFGSMGAQALRHVTVDQLGAIESGVGNLSEVLVLGDRIDNPSGLLREAVIANLALGVRYTFIVSSARQHDVDNWRKYFQALYSVAFPSGFGDPQYSFSDLFDIHLIPQAIDDCPYVYYIYEHNKIFGYRGRQKNAGIADVYDRLSAQTTYTTYNFVRKVIIRNRTGFPQPEEISVVFPNRSETNGVVRFPARTA